MSKRIYHGQPTVTRCERHGCKVAGTIRQFGFKWVAYLKCGHKKMLGYVLPVEEIRKRGWERSAGEDPRIALNAEEKKRQQQQERDSYERHLKHKEELTRGKYL